MRGHQQCWGQWWWHPNDTWYIWRREREHLMWRTVYHRHVPCNEECLRWPMDCKNRRDLWCFTGSVAWLDSTGAWVSVMAQHVLKQFITQGEDYAFEFNTMHESCLVDEIICAEVPTCMEGNIPGVNKLGIVWEKAICSVGCTYINQWCLPLLHMANVLEILYNHDSLATPLYNSVTIETISNSYTVTNLWILSCHIVEFFRA